MKRTIPNPILRFAERNILARSDTPGRVRFSQKGTMRLKPDASWKPFTAEQWVSEEKVAFCWHARVKLAPLLTAVVEDAFQDGHGRLDVKLWGALRVAHEEGPLVDRGEIQRYLAELPWNPNALVANPSLHFDAGDDGSVRVWVGDPQCYVDLHFDDEGDIVRTYSTTRPKGDDGPAPWEGRFSDYEPIGGVRVPRRGEVAWILPHGRFDYWRGELLTFELVAPPSASSGV